LTRLDLQILTDTLGHDTTVIAILRIKVIDVEEFVVLPYLDPVLPGIILEPFAVLREHIGIDQRPLPGSLLVVIGACAAASWEVPPRRSKRVRRQIQESRVDFMAGVCPGFRLLASPFRSLKERFCDLPQHRRIELLDLPVVGDEAVDLAFDVGGLRVDARGDALPLQVGEDAERFR
jgi:hypothetical protein